MLILPRQARDKHRENTQKQTVLLQELRASLGLCPQFDVLYDEMTAGQQLMLYGCMAGA